MIEVLDLHGLSSVELDPDGMHRLDHLVSGRAMFSPREGYPTLHGSVQMGERVPVTFWLAPASATTPQARRGRHFLSLLAAASIPPQTSSRLPSPQPTLHTQSPNISSQSKVSSFQSPRHPLLPLPSTSSHALAPSCLSTCDCARAPVPLASRIIALWEDVHGVWTVFAEDGDVDAQMSLEEWWREVVEGKLPNENGLQELEHQKEYQKEYQKEAQDGMKGGQAGVSDDKGQHGEWAEDKTEKDERDALHVYADATDILISIAETLLSLHQRRLLLSTVRPDFFACRKPRQSIPIASPSGNSYDATSSLGLSSLPRSTQPHRTLELRRFSSVVPLPGFAGLHQSAFPSHPHQSPDHSSTPLTRPSLLVSSSQDGEAGPSEDSGWAGEDEEAFIKANLRWLAPEIFSSKRSTSLSERADVYSFGVLMWELMTGSPIEPEVSDLLADIHNHLTAPVPNPADFVASSRSIPSFLSSEPMPELSQSLQSSSLDPLPVLSSSFCAPPRPPIPKALAEISLRCLQKDLDDRYTSIPTLLHDLREFQRLARSPSPSELEAFEVGAIDRASRFQLSLKLVDRTSQTEELDRAFAEVASSSPEERKGLMLKPGVLEVWGASGSGKTGVVTRWAKGLEKEGGGQKCLVGWAKLDQHLTKPLNAFVQIFTSLLDRIFSSPQEPHDAYREKILSALSGQGAVFFSLIPKEWRSVLLPNGRAAQELNEFDWDNFVAAFRGWAKRLLQIFASADRPLVIVLDDVQWLAEEAQLWSSILEGRLKHVLVVSIYRTDAPDVPPPIHLVSNVQQIQVSPLTDAGVAAFLGASFGWTDEQLKTEYLPLVRFCRSKTGGNPFHLQSLVASLYYEGSFKFDFESLSWTFNLIKAEANASDAMEDLDELLARSLGSLPIQVKLCIQTLACLPSSGFDLDPLSQLLDVPLSRLESYLGSPNLVGVVLVSESSVRFSHDRMQAAAYKLISAEEAPFVHFKIASWLQRSTFSEAFVYDAVDNMILARDLGYPLNSQDQLDDLAGFACQAAQRAASSASFTQALSYLKKADSIVDFSLGSTWTRLPDLSLQYAKTSSEIYGALRLYDEAVGRLQGYLAFASIRLEKLELLTLLARIHIASGSVDEAMETGENAMRSCGYEPHAAPKGPDVHILSRPELCNYEKILPAVQAFQTTELSLEEKEMITLTTLIAYLAPTLFSKREDQGSNTFALAISLLLRSRVVRSDVLSYLLGAWVVSNARSVSLEFAQAVCGLAHRLIENAPRTYLGTSAFISIKTQSHRTEPLNEIDFEPAYESAMHTSNYDAGAFIIAIAFATWLYSSGNFYERLPLIRGWFEQTSNMTQAARIFCSLPLQVAESFACTDKSLDQGWRFSGPFVQDHDYDVLSDLPFHSFAFVCSSVKLALFMRTAPLLELKKLVVSAEAKRAGASGIIWWCEWMFLHSIYLILHEPNTEANRAQIETNLEDLRASSCSIDFVIRIRIVNAFQAMASAQHWTEAMSTIETTVEDCCDHGSILLAGFLSSYAATWIVEKTGRTGPAALGYALSARDYYLRYGAIALARQVESAHPSLTDFQGVPSRYPSYPLPSSISKPSGDPIRADKSDGSSKSTSFRSDTTIASAHQDSKLASTLDNLTFVRASLVIASEKNPKQAVTHLLRLLLQLCRMDFAAIALLDPSGSGLRLRGAGSFQALEACDVSPVDATHLAPVSILLHVAQTRKAITSVSQLESIRDDPFWTTKRPKSALVLPLTLQGTFLGVLLLSSNSTLPSTTNTEIVSALASFAAVTLESRSQRVNLEDLVASRTKALEAALNAKSAFLNHMSHELRSPLFAILGLAAVLESSTDNMSPASQEHISQIILSGNDLQRVISNVLDVSKLSSGFVKVESLSFSLREVCEAAMSTVQIAAQKKNIEIVLTSPLELDPPRLLGDSFRVHQCLLNLLSNAAKFSRDGAIRISFTCEKSSGSSDRLITISVKDDGPGISEDALQNRLFKPFSQVDASITRSHGGSGLGLLIVKELAVMMGGDAWATSKVGEGSTFSFSVLVKDDPSPSAADEATSFPEQKALLLCNNSFSRQNLIANLHHLNVRLVTTFDTLAEALSPEIENSLASSPYDILLLNPDAVSKDQVIRVAALQPNARIFYLVNAIDLGVKVSELSLPTSSFLPKPIKRSNLYDIVRPHPKGESSKRKKKANVKTVSSQGIDSTLGSTAPLRILIVDDNKVNTVVGGKILERFGYKSIDICHDGLQACNRTLQEDYDLIFMDLSMPVMDGLEANRIISSRATPTRKPLIVALTANTDKDTEDLTVTEGFFGYLQKPLHIPSMARVLRESYELTKKTMLAPTSSQPPT